ncbi:MAG: hypothetical protein R6V86_01435 [Spirochaetia bacterium]
MSLFPNQEEPEIPERENSEVKEVFAYFGLCMYNLQIFKQGCVNLAVALQIKGLTKLIEKDFDSLFDRMSKKTLGQLISDVRDYVNISTKLEEDMNKMLKNRNYIVHRFFVKHDIVFMSSNGRVEMIEELRGISGNVQVIDEKVELITHSLWKKLGLTAEVVQKELKKMREEAKQKDL